MRSFLVRPAAVEKRRVAVFPSRAEDEAPRTLDRVLSRAAPWRHLFGADLPVHPSPRSLDDPSVVEYLLYLVGRGLTSHVLLLERLIQAHTVVEPVDDVPDNLLHAYRPAGAITE